MSIEDGFMFMPNGIPDDWQIEGFHKSRARHDDWQQRHLERIVELKDSIESWIFDGETEDAFGVNDFTDAERAIYLKVYKSLGEAIEALSGEA